MNTSTKELYKERNQVFIRCCGGYFLNGMTTLTLGAILPLLMAETGLGYIGAGSVISFYAIGSFLGSFVYTFLSTRFQHKNIIAILTCFIGIFFLLMYMLPSLWVINILMLLAGISKGAITLYNNYYTNILYPENPAPKANILNATFAVSAFISPFLLSFLILLGFNWKVMLYVISASAFISGFLYFTSDSKTMVLYRQYALDEASASHKSSFTFLKNKSFYILMILLFFYLGFEYSVNGWFVTYLEDSGLMDATLSNAMVSVMWLAILLSRLYIAKITQKIDSGYVLFLDSFGLLLGFLLLISTKNIYIIILSMILLGAFMAPVFPLVYAIARKALQGSTLAITLFSAGSALGGIIMPALVGILGERFSIRMGILVLVICPFLIILLARLHHIKGHEIE